MLHLVVPTAVAGIHFVEAVACMCSAAAGTVGAAAVLVLPDIHCLLAVGVATAAVVGVVATYPPWHSITEKNLKKFIEKLSGSNKELSSLEKLYLLQELSSST